MKTLPHIRLPKRTRQHFELHYHEPLRDSQVLLLAVEAHLREILDASDLREFVDVSLAHQVAASCRRLVDVVTQDTPEADRRLIQAAVLYFCSSEDADSDLDSPIGFDDDAGVANAVLAHFNLEQIEVP